MRDRAAPLDHARDPAPHRQVPLARNENACLFAVLVIQPFLDASYRLCWSAWRRRHQHRGRACHYQRPAAPGGHRLRWAMPPLRHAILTAAQ